MSVLNDAARDALEAGHLAHLGSGRKIGNLRRDPRITDGGGPELLQRLAHVYLGPDVKFPAWDDPAPGVIVHIRPERVGGVGPWTG
jgi:hypothetical protein